MRTLLFIALASLIVFFCLVGCSSLRGALRSSQVDEFSEYEQTFQREASIRGFNHLGNDVTISFGETLSTPLSEQLHATNFGVCIPASWMEEAHIVIDRVQWNRAPGAVRELLIVHELLHCTLDKQHTLNGIMRPQLITAAEYLARRVHLLDEAFGQRAPMVSTANNFDSLARIK